MQQETKPCPFCGGENVLTYLSKEYVPGTNMTWVFCGSCWAMSSHHQDIDESIKEWNRVSDLVHENINQQSEKK